MGRRRGAHHSPPGRHRKSSARPDREDYSNDYGTLPAAPQHKWSNSAPPVANKPSINSLKSKIRDITRFLSYNEDLPPGVRIEKERALAGYKQDVETVEQEKRKQALIARYHKVRFFERQKATRHVKKASKLLKDSEPDTPEHAAAQLNAHIAEVDLNYTLYSPLDQKYQGIYPREANEVTGNSIVDTEKILASRPAMWKVVENCMKDGTLEALRDGKLTTTLAMAGIKPSPAKAHARGPGGGVMIDFATRPTPTKADPSREQESSDDSDGGFFEKRGRWTIGEA